jgi:undecaprenyl-diphosphatase
MNVLMLCIAIQIIVESLPISSSGHWALACAFFSRAGQHVVVPGYLDHLLHGPTLLILILFFWQNWLSMIKNLYSVGFFSYRSLFAGVFGTLASSGAVKNPARLSLFFKIFGTVVIADLFTLVFYLVIKVCLKNVIFLQSPHMLLLGFCVTACTLFLTFLLPKYLTDGTRADTCNLVTQSLVAQKKYGLVGMIMGIVQGLALLPGISRFATTYAAARALGLTPRRAFQFSWLIFFPLLCAAFLGNGVRGLAMSGDLCNFFTIKIITHVFLATSTAYWLFEWTYDLALRERFWWFGVYMILPIACVIGLLR